MSMRPHALSVLLVPLLAVLAGCATPEPPPPSAATATMPEEPAAPQEPAKPTLRQDTLKHLANRNLKPIPTRPLNAKASCSFKDETGYRGRLQLDVKAAKVEKLQARVDVPKQGSCNFRLADFQQTGTSPIVVLASRQSECKVSLWEQGEQVTVAFRDCRAECSGGSADYLWPILVDNRRGSCS